MHAREPVLIVHGVPESASNYGKIRVQFLKKGYLDSEVYGTTYGDGEDANLYAETMKCEYVKQVHLNNLLHKCF